MLVCMHHLVIAKLLGYQCEWTGLGVNKRNCSTTLLVIFPAKSVIQDSNYPLSKVFLTSPASYVITSVNGYFPSIADWPQRTEELFRLKSTNRRQKGEQLLQKMQLSKMKLSISQTSIQILSSPKILSFLHTSTQLYSVSIYCSPCI